MSTKTTVRSKTKASFRVGDPVTFHFVNRTIRGVVSEDMGPIGVDGRSIYQVEVSDPTEEMKTFDLPEVRLSKAQD